MSATTGSFLGRLIPLRLGDGQKFQRAAQKKE
jgi:hypothetical protein